MLQSAAPEENFKSDVPTETPPPYFPQNPLSPGDERTARKMRLTFYGCAVLLALGLVGAIIGLLYFIGILAFDRWLH